MSENKPKPEKPQFGPSDAVADWPGWYALDRGRYAQTAATVSRVYTMYSVPTIMRRPTT
jgi:hypothetical protein